MDVDFLECSDVLRLVLQFACLLGIEAAVLENVLGIKVVLSEVQDHIRNELPEFELHISKINPLLDCGLVCSFQKTICFSRFCCSDPWSGSNLEWLWTGLATISSWYARTIWREIWLASSSKLCNCWPTSSHASQCHGLKLRFMEVSCLGCKIWICPAGKNSWCQMGWCFTRPTGQYQSFDFSSQELNCSGKIGQEQDRLPNR